MKVFTTQAGTNSFKKLMTERQFINDFVFDWTGKKIDEAGSAVS